MKSLDPTIHHLVYLVPILVLIFTHLRLIFVTLVSGTCAAGWTLHGTQCYKLIQVLGNHIKNYLCTLYFKLDPQLIPQSETATYAAAQAACAEYGTGGLLAAPTTAEIQVFSKWLSYPLFQGVLDTLNAAGTPADFWIGLDDQWVKTKQKTDWLKNTGLWKRPMSSRMGQTSRRREELTQLEMSLGRLPSPPGRSLPIRPLRN